MLPPRGWWWHRLHPAQRAALAILYYGGFIAIVAVLLSLEIDDYQPSSAATSGEQTADSAVTDEQSPAENQPSPVLTGSELYDNECAQCHGPKLEGAVGPALGRGSEAAEETDKRLLSRIVDGRREMPAFSQTLDAAEIQLVFDFLRDQQGR